MIVGITPRIAAMQHQVGIVAVIFEVDLYDLAASFSHDLSVRSCCKPLYAVSVGFLDEAAGVVIHFDCHRGSLGDLGLVFRPARQSLLRNSRSIQAAVCG